MHQVHNISYILKAPHGFERTEPERKSIVICLFTCGWCSLWRSLCHSAPKPQLLATSPQGPLPLFCVAASIQSLPRIIDFLKVKASWREKKRVVYVDCPNTPAILRPYRPYQIIIPDLGSFCLHWLSVGDEGGGRKRGNDNKS